MGSGFATIPQIDASVPVQATSSRVLRGVLPAAQPEQLREAAQGVGEIGKVLQVQYEHKKILDAETVADGVRNKFTELRAKNADLPGDQQASTFQQQSNEIVKAAIDDPANGHIKDYLTSELVKTQNNYYRESVMAGAAKTAQEHHQQVDKNGKQAAIIAGADYQVAPESYARNAQFAKPGPYETPLSSKEEAQFREWVTKTHQNFDPNDKAPQDYDARGYWKDVASKGGNQQAISPVDGKVHSPDTYKTPYDASFSAESKYATPDNPFKWQGESLIDQRSGKTVYQTGQPGGEDVGRNLVFTDGPTARAVEQKHFNTIDALYGRNPEIAQELKDTYQQQKTFERAQAIALNDPKNLTAFLKSPQSAVMGQGAKTTLLLKSLQIQDLATKKVNVDMDSLETQTFNKFLDDKKNGNFDLDAATKAAGAGLLKPDHLQFLAGHPIQAPETPTDPAVKADVEARIASAPSAFALDALAASLTGKRGLTESERAIQRDKIEKQKALLETPVKQAEDRYKADLRTYYEPTTGAERRDRHGVLKNATTLGDAMWEAGVAEIKAKGGSPEQQTTALLRLKADVMKAHQKPTGEALRGETVPVPTTSAVPPGVPALSPEEIMNHGRSLAP